MRDAVTESGRPAKGNVAMDGRTVRDQSLEELEGKFWGDPPADATRVVATVYRLRQVPIGHLDVEGLRLLIGQHEGLDPLVPLAIEILETDPLAEGDYYPGDLLAAVLAVPANHWRAHLQDHDRLSVVLDTVTDPQGKLREEAGFDVDEAAISFRRTITR